MPLFERAEELTFIKDSLRTVAGNHSGRMILFEGPAGIGKTSMVAAAEEVGRDNAFLTLSARGKYLEQEYAWGLVIDLFAPALDSVDDHAGTASATAPAVNLIRTRNTLGSHVEYSEWTVLNSLFSLLSGLAARRPVLLLLDDLHWADIATLRFIAYVTARLDGVPVLLVGAVRPGDGRTADVFSAIAADPRVHTRPLRPFGPGGTSDLLATVLGAQANESLAHRCHELTNGNPLLIRELGRELAHADDAGVDRVLRTGVPSIDRYVNRQLRQLPGTARRTVECLAVLGDQSSVTRIAAVADTSPSQVLDDIAVLLDDALVVQSATAPRTFSMAHPLVRSSVYESLTYADRARLHARAADVAFSHDQVATTAAHLLNVPPGISTLDVAGILIAAAAASMAAASPESAAAFLRRALDEDLGDRRPAVLRQLGMIEVAIDNDGARDHLEAALAGTTTVEVRAELTVAIAGTHWFRGDPKLAYEVIDKALRDRHVHSVGSIRALQAYALLMTLVARIPVPDTFVDGLRSLAPDPSTGGRMLDGVLALRATFDNRRPEARERALRAIADGALARHPLAESSLACAWTALIACGTDGAELGRSFDYAIEHTHARGSLRALGPATAYRGLWMFQRGDLHEAVTDGRTSWDVGMTYGTTIGKAFSGSYLMPSLVAHGQLRQAESVADEVLSVSAKVPAYVSTHGFAAVAAARGDVDDAIAKALAGRDSCMQFGVRNPLMAGWRPTLVRGLTLRQRHDEARSLAAEGMSWASDWGTKADLGRALYCTSLVTHGEARTELLREAVDLLEGADAKLDLALARFALGDAYRRTKKLREAKRLLQAGLDVARSCGAGPLAQTCANSLRMIGARPSVSSTLGPESLTPGELRVAELATRGLSNKEIAQSLFVTVKTVEVHLSNAYRKLDISRRHELARALDKGAGR